VGTIFGYLANIVQVFLKKTMSNLHHFKIRVNNIDNWKTILTFTYPHEANIAKAYLNSEGIETIIQNEMTAQLNNVYSNAIGESKC
jgi:hypothetical protein